MIVERPWNDQKRYFVSQKAVGWPPIFFHHLIHAQMKTTLSGAYTGGLRKSEKNKSKEWPGKIEKEVNGVDES